MKLDFFDVLFEGTTEDPRIPHPENAIFAGSAEAKRALDTLKEIVANPEQISIKWDGEIALFFGRDARGQFFCSDKYMYPKGILAHSVQDWMTYDQNKATKGMRPDVYKKLQVIWSSLESSIGPQPVTYKGDYFTLGGPVKGQYVFAGPTAKYGIPVNSVPGQALAGKNAVIFVHSMNGKPWDGGGLQGAGNVALLEPNLGNKFGLGTYDRQLVQFLKNTDTTLNQYGSLVDKFLSQLGTQSAKKELETYFNQRITLQTNLEIDEYLKQKSPANYKKLIGDNQGGILFRNIKGWNALKMIYNSIYQLKDYMDRTFTQQVKNVAMSTPKGAGGEGFVFNSPTKGPYKLVSTGFRQSHFLK